MDEPERPDAAQDPAPRETAEEAAARYPELAGHFRECTEEDQRHDRRMVWRELLVLLIVAAVVIVRAIWLV